MTSKLKCPFCQTELEQMHDKKLLGCPKCLHIADGAFWKKAIQAKQDLEQSEKCCSAWETQALDYKAETIALSGKLEIATKALEEVIEKAKVAVRRYEYIGTNIQRVARKALEQIEHKEQQIRSKP